MNKDHTNELEFAQIEKRLQPRLMQMGREFFDLRHLIMFILVGLVTGIAVASAIHPNGVVRGAIEHVLGIPEDTTIYLE